MFTIFYFFVCNNAIVWTFRTLEDGKTYNLVMYVKSAETVPLTVSLTSSDGLQNLASVAIMLVCFLSTMLGSEEELWLLTLLRNCIVQGCRQIEMGKGRAKDGC